MAACDQRRRRRRSWRGLFVLAGCVCAASAAPANIDVGFAQDGRTTYCQGIQQDEGPLVFETLTPSSAGKCPIDVQILAEATAIAPQTPLAVKWAATVHRGALTANLFPSAVDPATKKPQDVIASLLRACKSGTNCALPESVVEPAVFVDDPSTDTGVFDANGTKTLRSYEFQFPSAGDDYVIVGKVVLPGDPKLNISATEFITFQRVRVGTNLNTTSSAAATVRPGAAGEVVSDSDVAMITKSSGPTTEPQARSASEPSTTRSPVGGETSSTGSGQSGVDMKTVSIAGVAGVALVLIVVGYALMGIKDKRKLEALAQGRPTRTFSMSFQNLDSDDPEPVAPIRRNLSRGSSRPSTRVPSSRSSHVDRQSRQSRVSRMGGAKVPGGDTRTPRASVVRGHSVRGVDVVAVGGGRGTFTIRQSTASRQSQYAPTGHSRWSPVAMPKEIVRASSSSAHQPRYTNGSNGSWATKPYRPSTKSTGSQPKVVRVTRVLSTSSTKSEDYSGSEGSSYSMLHGSVGSFETAAIMESAEANDYSLHRKSSVVLLEDARDSDLSSLGSLHDESEELPPVTRMTGVSSSSHGSSALTMSQLDQSTTSTAFYRQSSRISKSTMTHSSVDGRSTFGSSGYAPRDTSECNAPFAERNSESDWYQL